MLIVTETMILTEVVSIAESLPDDGRDAELDELLEFVPYITHDGGEEWFPVD